MFLFSQFICQQEALVSPWNRPSVRDLAADPEIAPPPTHTHTHKFTTKTSVGVHLQRQASEHMAPACLCIFSYLHHLSTSADLTHLFIAAVSSHIRILSPLMKPRCCLRSLSTFYVRAVLGCHLYERRVACLSSFLYCTLLAQSFFFMHFGFFFLHFYNIVNNSHSQ